MTKPVAVLAQDVSVEATRAREPHNKCSARKFERHSLHSVEVGMRIIGQTAGGSHCEVLPSSNWTCHDLHRDAHRQLGVPVSQQRLLHGNEPLGEFMAAAAVGTMGHLLQLSAGHEGILELHKHTHIHIHIHIYIHIHIHIYTHIHIYMYTPTPIHLYTYTPIHLYTYTPIHLYTYTPIHLYTYTYL